jgi:hypothetical protein
MLTNNGAYIGAIEDFPVIFFFDGDSCLSAEDVAAQLTFSVIVMDVNKVILDM